MTTNSFSKKKKFLPEIVLGLALLVVWIWGVRSCAKVQSEARELTDNIRTEFVWGPITMLLWQEDAVCLVINDLTTTGDFSSIEVFTENKTYDFVKKNGNLVLEEKSACNDQE